jgi:transposase
VGTLVRARCPLALPARSSGEQRRQGSITKVGNAHVRRLLVESAWHARRPPPAVLVTFLRAMSFCPAAGLQVVSAGRRPG